MDTALVVISIWQYPKRKWEHNNNNTNMKNGKNESNNKVINLETKTPTRIAI